MSNYGSNNDAGFGVTISLPPTPTGWFEYGYTILSDGKLALIRADQDMDIANRRWREAHQNQATLFQWESRIRLSTFDGTCEGEALELTTSNWPLVDRLVDGRWVVVSSRASGTDKNARLYFMDGRPAGDFAIGDGVVQIRCAADGSIWVGYSDEGIYAGQNDDGSWPISSSGIVRFAPEGRLVWRLDQERLSGLAIDASYALGIAGDTLWGCPYSDFPIISIQGGLVRVWRNVIKGARTIAIDGSHVVLAGGYGDDFNRIALLRLGDDEAHYLGELRFSEGPGSGARLIQGYGSTIHILGDGRWTRFDVSLVRSKLQAG